MKKIEEFLSFLDNSPSAFHACKNIENSLKKGSFSPLLETEKWSSKKGGAFFVTRGDSLVVAFRLPKKPPKRAWILASHIDSPSMKLKPHPELKSGSAALLSTETYGAPLLHTWMDRDLRVAGKIYGEDKKKKPCSFLVDLKDTPISIPSLSLHLDRSVVEKGALFNKQDHLRAVFSLQENFSLLSWLQKHVPIAHLLGADLFAVPSEKPSLLGEDSSLIASHRLDNLSSAYAALQAMLYAKPKEDQIVMSFFWNHEEIGSKSSLGADSVFALEVMQRIAHIYKLDLEEFCALKSRSLCLSADVTHALHPNYLEKSDGANAPRIGKGVALKFNASQKYATAAEGASIVREIARKKKICLQDFASRSDIPSGSTVGPFMGAQLGISTVDLGIGCWGMHSARETVAKQDVEELEKLLTAVLEA